MLALLLVAVSLGLSNFAASVGIGAGGVDTRMRLRVGLVFGFFETAMPIAGLLAGRGVASALGPAAQWLGGALLIAAGVYSLIQARLASGDEDDDAAARQRLGRLLVTGLALSIDNLAVGFALGAVHVSLPVAVVVIGAVSVTLSLLGLELGHRISVRLGSSASRGEVLGGLVLIGVGIAVACGAL
jgi:putative Mn2+ efflux pump MntP